MMTMHNIYPCKSAYRSLSYIDIILFVKTILYFKHFFLVGYPAIRRMKPDIRPDNGYKKGRISGTTLVASYQPTLEELLSI